MEEQEISSSISLSSIFQVLDTKKKWFYYKKQIIHSNSSDILHPYSVNR